MGMYGILLAASAAEIAAWRERSDDDLTLVWFGDDEATTGLVDDDDRAFHLDKLWAAIDFVLTGARLEAETDAPLDVLRLDQGGEPLGPDLGYGAAKVLSPEDVTALHEALVQLDTETIGRRVRSPELSSVYPFSIVKLDAEGGPRPDEDDRRAIERCLTDLVAFVASLARDGQGMIVMIQ